MLILEKHRLVAGIGVIGDVRNGGVSRIGSQRVIAEKVRAERTLVGLEPVRSLVTAVTDIVGLHQIVLADKVLKRYIPLRLIRCSAAGVDSRYREARRKIGRKACAESWQGDDGKTPLPKEFAGKLLFLLLVNDTEVVNGGAAAAYWISFNPNWA